MTLRTLAIRSVRHCGTRSGRERRVSRRHDAPHPPPFEARVSRPTAAPRASLQVRRPPSARDGGTRRTRLSRAALQFP
jgi:hypothetical protein